MSIPTEIAHLDFAPTEETHEQQEITPGTECCAFETYPRFFFGRRRTECHNLATWLVTLRCCMVEAPCCEHHRTMKTAWRCTECGHTRSEDWAAWRPLTT